MKGFLYETFTASDIAKYARAWGCSYVEAEKQLEKLIVDQVC
jgi:hypothetical protein